MNLGPLILSHKSLKLLFFCLFLFHSLFFDYLSLCSLAFFIQSAVEPLCCIVQYSYYISQLITFIWYFLKFCLFTDFDFVHSSQKLSDHFYVSYFEW